LEKGKEILEIAYDSPCFWRKEWNFKKCIWYSTFLKKGKKFHKLHMIVHVFGEGKEISKIACDSPCFWRRKRNFI